MPGVVESSLANGYSAISKIKVIVVLSPSIVLCGSESRSILLLEVLSLLSMLAPLAFILAFLAVILFSVSPCHVIRKLRIYKFEI
jgi:hypothetical protein